MTQDRNGGFLPDKGTGTGTGARGDPAKTHRAVLEDRRLLTLTGVLDVDSYDDHAVCAKTAGGSLTVEGEGLHVKRLSLEEGILELEGVIGAFYYTDAPAGEGKGFFARLFR